MNASSILTKDEDGPDREGATPPSGPGDERRFRRFGEAVAQAPVQGALGLTPPPPAAPELEVVEESSGDAFAAKPFLGPNATYYDDRWRWMSWRGRSRGWNWAAAASLGVWLAYRRMYRWAALYVLAFSLLLLLAAGGVPMLLIGVLLVAGTLALGTFANSLYFRHFSSVARAVEAQLQGHDARLRAMIAAGGVDPAAAGLMVAGLIGAGCLALGLGLVAGGLTLMP